MKRDIVRPLIIVAHAIAFGSLAHATYLDPPGVAFLAINIAIACSVGGVAFYWIARAIGGQW